MFIGLSKSDYIVLAIPKLSMSYWIEDVISEQK